MLIHIPNVLNAQQVQSFCQHLEAPQAPWVDGRVTAGYQGAGVKQNQQISEVSELAQILGDAITTSLECNPLFISAALPNRIYPPLFNRYQHGMHFGPHVDGSIRLIPGTGMKLRTDISATLFLSHPDSYDGGELVVQDTFGLHHVKLPAGDLVLYPASSTHHVTAVTRGQRMASFFWIQSLIRDDAQRTLLFDLDTAIQRLNQGTADADALVTLVGNYHNLLRMWSDV